MIIQAERGAEATQPNRPFTHAPKCTASQEPSLPFALERCERLSCTREGRIKGEETLVETGFAKFPDTGKNDCTVRPSSSGSFSPWKRGKASKQLNKLRETAIRSLHFQPHPSGIIIANDLHPPSIRAYLMPSDAGTLDHAYLHGDKQDLWTRSVHQTNTAPFLVIVLSFLKMTG